MRGSQRYSDRKQRVGVGETEGEGGEGGRVCDRTGHLVAGSNNAGSERHTQTRILMRHSLAAPLTL